MNIFVIGGGGREHAITWALRKSKLVKRIVIAPGNPGIEKIAECRNIAIDDLNNLTKTAKEIKADLVFIGPELPLVLGLKNKLDELGIKAFGPSLEAAKLEGSKIFSRDFCKNIEYTSQNILSVLHLKKLKKQLSLFKDIV